MGHLGTVLNIGSISQADIDTLIDACEPAPFGRGPDSVLDDGYRKALKLDEKNLAWRFNPDSGDFIAQLAQRLCPWKHIDQGFRAEVTKLNVYTQGGFFKAHKDTPKSHQMFGSLVFTLQTPHTGGNLVLRHQDRSLNFDAPSLLNFAPKPAVAYVAFYSDVEHEVLEVTSGARITITFNLYYDSTRAPPILSTQRSHHTPLLPDNPVLRLLRRIIHDAGYDREWYHLGFSLEHQYPWSFTDDDPRGPAPLKNLKGTDMFLLRALEEVGLKPSLRYLYESEADSWGNQFDILLSEPILGRDACYGEAGQMAYLFRSDFDAQIVWRKGQSEETLRGIAKAQYERDPLKYSRNSVNVEWVTPPDRTFAESTPSQNLGNEPSHEVYYYSVCIVVDISDVDYDDVSDVSEVSDDSDDSEDSSVSSSSEKSS
ncbi:hypothetical protein NP233_g10667 [Leucocoprinus birnbaumii]|uniref:Fe2OG dioxygenase domain-containing protein n=1 Tax=Leucocoprinus birnbaumii TaxID=56174 RepID=A0AAD5VIC9_9AGAR|nr:hypothetical protein NP233_g10667 [Leucocoprinus birnbaumii]